jgi:hypothetical protein
VKINHHRRERATTPHLDAAETARLAEVARTYNSAPWDAPSPSDADLTIMRAEIKRIDGIDAVERNAHPKFTTGVYVESVERDRRRRDYEARLKEHTRP